MFKPHIAGYSGRVAKQAFVTLLALALLCSPGCSKEDVKKMAATVKEKSQSIAESTKEMATQAAQTVEQTVEEQLPETGKATLQVSPPLQISSANIEVISIGDGRSNVVQIANYDVGAGPNTYPSFLIQGNTEAGDPASLAGQTLQCDLYMRASSSAPIAMTASGQQAQVVFKSYDPEKKTVAANIERVALISSDNKAVSMNGGSIVAVVSAGGS